MTPSSQKTVIIAASVLSVLAFFQLLVVFVVLVRHPNPGSITNASMDTPTSNRSQTTAGRLPSAPSASERAPTGAALPDESTIAPSEVEILVKRATDIRDQGDMTGALASLRDAQKLFPDDPKIIAQFATTYEQMGLVDKALAQWKRVVEAGEKAGDLYGVAAEKVRTGVIPRDPASGRDDEGLQPGSTLGIVDAAKNYDSSNPAVEKISVRMGIKARANAVVNASAVNIQAMFYDLVANQEVESTDPRTTSVTSEWLTPPPDWREDGLEVLKVRYEQKPVAAAENAVRERKYLGYIIRVYYENELQDVIAEPVKLLQNFPPPVSLQKEIPQ